MKLKNKSITDLFIKLAEHNTIKEEFKCMPHFKKKHQISYQKATAKVESPRCNAKTLNLKLY